MNLSMTHAFRNHPAWAWTIGGLLLAGGCALVAGGLRPVKMQPTPEKDMQMLGSTEGMPLYPGRVPGYPAADPAA